MSILLPLFFFFKITSRSYVNPAESRASIKYSYFKEENDISQNKL